MKSCYVHIPFCQSICSYCDFCRTRASRDMRNRWMEQMQKEIQGLDISNLDTLYFGGGTPSALDCDEFDRLASMFQGADEFTVECNPESLDEEKVILYKQHGVNRISLGVQSFQDDLLKKMNRSHTKKDVFSVIDLLRRNGLSNISIDLIYGLPGQTLNQLKEDIEIFCSLDIPHLSIYSLQIEENSVFGKQGVIPCEAELEADMYECICKELEMYGYHHYEISSFCKNGFHSKHNLSYWQDEDFIGIGVGASGKEKGVRYDNTRNIKEYLEHGPCRSWVEETLEERAFDAIMMSLRTSFGLEIERWNHRYQMDFLEKYQDVLNKYEDVLQVKNGILIPSVSAMEILNTILVDFLMVD